MALASRDAELRAALFRLVDVTPATHSLDDLARHLSEYLDDVEERPPPLDVAMRMAGSAAGRRALGAATAAGVRHMAHRFIVGQSPKDALGVLRDLWHDGVASSVDLLGEATVTQPEANRYAARCAEALDVLAAAYARWPDRPQLEHDSAGPLPRANLSVKVSALTPLLRPDAPDIGREDAAVRLRPLLREAIASHNLRSVAHAIAYDRANGGGPGDVEFQVLRGLGDDLARALASMDLRVRAYCPVGDLVAGMAYLVRRLLENTSNESFLYEQATGVPLEELLAAP